MSDVAVEVRNLRMRYGPKEVLSGVDFGLRTGEVVAMLAPNGAGKTTTIEILEGFRMRSAGEVAVLGQDPAHAGEAWRARIGVVLQSWRDHAKWRVRELLRHLGAYYGRYGTSEIARPWDTDELLDVVGLSAQAHARIGNLSGGQRRRLDVAIGIVGRPELLFLDEPTAGFDPAARREFHELVHRLTDLERATVLLTTHDLAEAEKLADRVIILAGGTIIADGSPDELALRLSGQAEVRWTRDGQRFVHPTDQATKFTRELFRQFGESVEDLEVRRPNLEDTYMTLVQEYEQVFPIYWLGLGMRAALLPDALQSVELDGSWRLGYVLLALCGCAAGRPWGSWRRRRCCGGWRSGSRGPRSWPGASARCCAETEGRAT